MTKAFDSAGAFPRPAAAIPSPVPRGERSRKRLYRTPRIHPRGRDLHETPEEVFDDFDNKAEIFGPAPRGAVRALPPDPERDRARAVPRRRPGHRDRPVGRGRPRRHAHAQEQRDGRACRRPRPATKASTASRSLPPGTYTLTVEKAGFKKTTLRERRHQRRAGAGPRRGAHGRRGRRDRDGDERGPAPALDTENANVNKAITTQEIKQLPQFGRDPYELLRLTPGIFGDAGARRRRAARSSLPNSTGPGGSNTRHLPDREPAADFRQRPEDFGQQLPDRRRRASTA